MGRAVNRRRDPDPCLPGGIVVHVSAGVSALVLAKLLGERRGFPKELKPPHSPSMTLIEATMLRVARDEEIEGLDIVAHGERAYEHLAGS